MNTTISTLTADKAVAHIVDAIERKGGMHWDGDNAMYEGICGWNGVMSPINRAAFVAKFGEAVTAEFERKANEVIAKRKEFWENSKAKGYMAQADSRVGVNPADFAVGSFVWGINNGLKCDHANFRENMRDFYEYGNKDERKPDLCKIIRIMDVEDVTDSEILRKWKQNGNEGGDATDDLTEADIAAKGGYGNLTDEEKRTFYTEVVLVRDGNGRFYLVDPEGYDYPLYVLLPKDWEDMYRELCAEIKDEMEAEAKREIAAAKAKAAAERKAAYDARCAKWEGLMETVPEGLNTYDREYRKIGKRNVAAMAKAAFPWVRFSVSYDGGWGTGYVLKWKNGPTVDEVRNACDFGLFEPWSDTYDGMTDSFDTVSAEFTEFSRKFGGVGNGVDLKREECDHDNNGDPNKPTRKPVETEDVGNAAEIAEAKREIAAADGEGFRDNGDPAKGEAYWRENKAKHGIEIYFPAVPSEGVRGDMKLNGWRYSKWNKCWYNRFNEGTWEKAREIVMCYNQNKGVA